MVDSVCLVVVSGEGPRRAVTGYVMLEGLLLGGRFFPETVRVVVHVLSQSVL